MVDGSANLWATFTVAFTGQQDLTTFTKGGSDPDPFTSVTATTATQLNLLNNEDNYLYKDFGVEAFGSNFIHLFRFKLTGLVTSSETVDRLNFWALTNYVSDYTGGGGGGGNFLGLLMQGHLDVDPQYQLRLRGDGKDDYIPFGGSVSGGTTYYARVIKVGRQVDIKIYTNAAMTALKDQGSITLNSDRKYRYAYATQGLNQYEDGYGSAGSTSYFKFYDLYIPAPAELKAGFTVNQWQEDLKAIFEVGQGSEELKAEFISRPADAENLHAFFRAGKIEVIHIYTSRDDFEPEQIILDEIDTAYTTLIPETETVTIYTVFGAPSEVLFAKLWVNQGIRNLKAKFYIQLPSEELKAGFTVGQWRQNLLAEFLVAHPGSRTLKAGFDVGQGYADLKAGFQTQLYLSLHAEFLVRPHDDKELKAIFRVGQETRNLYCSFMVPTFVSYDMHSVFIVIHGGTLDLKSGFFILQGIADLKARFDIGQDIAELKAYFTTMWSPTPLLIHARFMVRQGTGNLLAGFNIINNDAGNLAARVRVSVNTVAVRVKALFMISSGNYIYDIHARFEVRQSFANLKARFYRGTLASDDLLAGFICRTIDVANLLGGFYIPPHDRDLYARFTVPQWYGDLKSGFFVNADSAQLFNKMMVNYGEDYQEYTEYDPRGIVTLVPGNEANELVISGHMVYPYNADNVARFYRSCTPYVLNLDGGDFIEIQVEGYINSILENGDGDWAMAVLFALSDSSDNIFLQSQVSGYNFFALAGGQYSTGDWDFWLIGRSDDQGLEESYLNSVYLATKYYLTIRRDPAVSVNQVSVYLYSDEARTNLIEETWIYFSTDEPLVYIHAAGLYVYPSTADIDDDEVTLTASKLRIFGRSSGTTDLLAGFTVGQGAVTLKAGFATPWPAVDLLAHITVREVTYVELLTSFTVQRSSSVALRAGFDAQVTRNLKAGFIVTHFNTEDLLGKISVRHTLEPFRVIVEDTWQTWLNYWARVGTGRISYPIRTDDTSEYYSGVNSHKIYTQTSRRGSETLIFGWSRTPYTDLKPYESRELKAAATLRRSSTLSLIAGFTVLQGREDLKASMKVTSPDTVELLAGFTAAQPDSEDLLGKFTARHQTSVELKAGFTSRWLTGAADLLGETNVRRSSSRNLQAKLVVVWLPGTAELHGVTLVRHSGSRSLRAGFYGFTLNEELLAGFSVRRSSSRSLIARFEGQVRKNLLAGFISRPQGGADLLGGFTVRHAPSQGTLVDNMGRWINYWEQYGTGFLSLPVISIDGTALVVNMTYEEDSEEALIFGWSQHPEQQNTARRSLNLLAGFTIGGV